jgi:hypothetical protein
MCKDDVKDEQYTSRETTNKTKMMMMNKAKMMMRTIQTKMMMTRTNARYERKEHKETLPRASQRSARTFPNKNVLKREKLKKLFLKCLETWAARRADKMMR